jgi:hypothetical protein
MTCQEIYFKDISNIFPFGHRNGMVIRIIFCARPSPRKSDRGNPTNLNHRVLSDVDIADIGDVPEIMKFLRMQKGDRNDPYRRGSQ